MQQAFQTFSPAQIAPDLTDRDLSHDLAPVAGRGGLHVQFFYLQVRAADANPGGPSTLVTKLCVAKMPIGDRLTCATRFISEAAAMREFPAQFAQFKSTGEMPTTGTPITELPGISQAQVGLLLIHNIRSVEDLAGLMAEQVQMMGLDVHHAWNVARRWLERKDENADLTKSAAREAALEAAAMEANRRAEAAERKVVELEAEAKVMARMGGAQQVPGMVAHAAIAAGGAIPVEGETFDATPPSALFEGGMANGSDDLDEPTAPAPTRTDPLGIAGRKK